MEEITKALDLAEMELKAMYERLGYKSSNILTQIDKAREQVKNCSIPNVVESYCSECGVPCFYDICDDCDDERARIDSDYWEQDDDEPDYSDFDCTCGAWEWSEKQGRPIHIADCICGSSEPWT